MGVTKVEAPKPKVHAFNELLTCQLCQGYLVEPTTIDICLHTYCRSCIIKYLTVKSQCPQCGEGGTAISRENLKCDNILRGIIYKLIPDLYNKEQERILQFWNAHLKNNMNFELVDAAIPLNYNQNEFFSPTDPISLSLEYSPRLVKEHHVNVSPTPPKRYLQCPASLTIEHLKQFLCSKYNINVRSRYFEMHIMYEDENLSNDFSLMDVAYCYEWKQHAPMKLTYAILKHKDFKMTLSKLSFRTMARKRESAPEVSWSHSSERQAITRTEEMATKIKTQTTTATAATITITRDVNTNTVRKKVVSFKDQVSPAPAPSSHVGKVNSNGIASAVAPLKLKDEKRHNYNEKETEKRKGKISTNIVPAGSSSKCKNLALLANDFKSLRSNNMKYNNRAIIESPGNQSNQEKQKQQSQQLLISSDLMKNAEYADFKSPGRETDTVSVAKKCTNDFENIKKANVVKSSDTSIGEAATTTQTVNINVTKNKTKNIPKLKIELNNLKTKLIEKPKSADIRLDTLFESRPNKFRKISVDDYILTATDRIDLKTYAKNIGLKPIEIQTNVESVGENNSEKCTPNASPMSSSSASTISSSSNSNMHLASLTNTNNDISSTTPIAKATHHKKRKKKHSKELKKSKDSDGISSKRKKLHAEIASNSPEQSLKMKVRLTPPHTSKYINKQQQNKRLQHFLSPEVEILSTNVYEMPLDVNKFTANIKELKVPPSSPVPPSLFKTAPLTFTTFSTSTSSLPSVTSVTDAAVEGTKLAKRLQISEANQMPKPLKTVIKATDMVRIKKSLSMAPMLYNKSPYFAIPYLPKTCNNDVGSIYTNKLCGTPASIASEANKQMGNILKRSISLDESTIQNRNSGISKASDSMQVNRVNNDNLKKNYHSNDILKETGDSASFMLDSVPSHKLTSISMLVHSPNSSTYNQTSYSLALNVSKESSSNNLTPLKLTEIISPNITFKKLSATMASSASSTQKSTPTTLALVSALAAKDIMTTKEACTSASVFNRNRKTANSTLMGPPLPVPKLIRKSSLTGLNIIPTTAKSPPLGSVLSLNSTKPTANLSSIALRNPSTFLSPLELKFCNRVPSMLPPKNRKSSSHLNKVLTGDTTTHIVNTNASTKLKGSHVNYSFNAFDKPKSTLRDFRLPTRNTSLDVLDLTASNNKSGNCLPELMKVTLAATTPVTTTTTAVSILTGRGDGLEMTLRRLKQTFDSNRSVKNNANNNNNNNSSNVTSSSSLDKVSISPSSGSSPNCEDLLNLQLLSESATAREKIVIPSVSKSASAASSINTTTLLPLLSSSLSSISPTTMSLTSASIYEKSKAAQCSLVRQQNASVRNIPNPSALAFRNQQPILVPLVTVPLQLSNNGNYLTTTTTNAMHNTHKFKDSSGSLYKLQATPSTIPPAPSLTTLSVTPPTTCVMRQVTMTQTKKHTTIDEVAATLNIRAAAAEALYKANSESVNLNLIGNGGHNDPTLLKVLLDEKYHKINK